MPIFQKVLRVGEGKTLKEFEATAVAVNSVESDFVGLTDEELTSKTAEFRDRLANGATVDDIQIEAFAVVREASTRVLGQRHYDVQVVGAAALHRGMVAEMKTGEGKTLVSTMPAYLNALVGNGLHMVTVNDYLASRDAEWMGGVYRFLGLSVGLIQNNMPTAERHPAYRSDITYGTNNEFGFDYLRDNMAMDSASRVHRGYQYAIVDEVDSILIDEARTPLIISGKLSDSAKWYRDFAKIASRLKNDLHYTIDEAKRQVLTTEEGVERVEQILGIENLYDHAAVDFVHHMETALKAEALYKKDVDYLLDGGEVKIVDEFTGRILEGRRYSEGLHQAIEAKEGVHIKEENQTLATITLQNYFRLYEKLAGMTGTAQTEAAELASIYGLEVLSIPTNRPIARMDQGDLVYKSEAGKLSALVRDVKDRYERKQPILLGTISIERSELLSNALERVGVKHEVLNAKAHAREADIIAQAGRPGAVTVATNMAGRGVDIMLGGNPEGMARTQLKKQGVSIDDPSYDALEAKLTEEFEEQIAPNKEIVINAGGLYVVGTERHDSRRIDNQLRGRSGRQGDPGESRFYLSLEDDLMRRFQGEWVSGVMEKLRLPEDQPIEAKMVSKSIERAQRQVESQNFEIRKNVLKYDEVMNRQREVVYDWRKAILERTAGEGLIEDWIADAIAASVELEFSPDLSKSEWDWDALKREIEQFYVTKLDVSKFEDGYDLEDIIDFVTEEAMARYAEHGTELGPDILGRVETSVMLSVIDNKWREHLSEMDYLRAGIGLRAMGQRDPLTEYQREGFEMFTDLVDAVKRDAVKYLFHVEIAQPKTQPQRVQAAPTGSSRSRKPAVSAKIGRNDPCPCGSGKKYKKCHGAA